MKNIFIYIFFLGVSISIIGCRYGFDPASNGGGSTDRIGTPGGRNVPNCNQSQDDSYNACIYDKNPVAQSGRGLSDESIISQLATLQTYAVSIVGSTEGVLKNSKL